MRKNLQITTSHGFTLLELVLIILLIGIMSAVAFPRFFSSNDYKQQGFYDEAASAVRYAQKVAVASGCNVQVSISGGGYALDQHAASCTSGAFTLPVPHPSGSGGFSAASPSGTVFSSSPSAFYFNSLGEALDSTSNTISDVTVTVGSRTFTVVGESGYVDTQ